MRPGPGAGVSGKCGSVRGRGVSGECGRRVYQSIKDKLTSDMIVMQEVSLSPKITMTDISDLDKWDMICLLYTSRCV